MQSIYQNHGWASRAEYLQDLADNYNIDIEVVQAVADLLGPSEDFDGLVNALDDMEVIWE